MSEPQKTEIEQLQEQYNLFCLEMGHNTVLMTELKDKNEELVTKAIELQMKARKLQTEQKN